MSPYFSWPGHEFQNRNNFLFYPQFSCAARDLLKTCKNLSHLSVTSSFPLCHSIKLCLTIHLCCIQVLAWILTQFNLILIELLSFGNLAKVCRSVNINGKPLSDTKTNTIFWSGLVVLFRNCKKKKEKNNHRLISKYEIHIFVDKSKCISLTIICPVLLFFMI